MNTTFATKLGSTANRVIAYFVANPEAEVGSTELCQILKLEPTNLSSLLKPARLAGAIGARKIGHTYFWRKGNGVPTVEDEAQIDESTTETPASSFGFALWSDGELAIHGATQTDSGIILTVQQTAQLFAYANAKEGYLEYLGRQALEAK